MAWFFPFPLTLYLDDPEPGFTCRFFHSQLSFRAWLIKFYFGVQLGHRSQIFNYYNTDRAYWEPRSSTNIFILTKKNDCTNVRLQYVQENINSSISSIRPLLVLLEYRTFDIENLSSMLVTDVGDGLFNINYVGDNLGLSVTDSSHWKSHQQNDSVIKISKLLPS